MNTYRCTLYTPLIYHGDNCLSIHPHLHKDYHHLTDANIAKILEDLKSSREKGQLKLETPTRNYAYSRLASQFKYVQAAGGIVRNAKEELLLIYRNGRWDLPKGHMEAGESATACAVREVAEETGVKGEIVRFLHNTHHIYNVYGEWEWKQTYWFEMYVDEADTAPQHDEGIERVEWVSIKEARERINTSYKMLAEVMGAIK